jgi:hypothetical protein
MGKIIEETIPDFKGTKGIIKRDMDNCPEGQCVLFSFSEFTYNNQIILKRRVESILVLLRKQDSNIRYSLRWAKDSFKIYKSRTM